MTPAYSYLVPVLTVAGLPTLAFVVMRSLPYAARGVVMLLAGVVAIMTRNPERRESCHKVLDSIRDSEPPCKLDPDLR